MEMTKSVLCWLLVIIFSPFLITLVLLIWVILYLVWEIGYWCRKPYDWLLDTVEELFSGGRGEYD